MAALTANKVRPSKGTDKLLLVPVASGEVIYQGSIVGITASGLLENVDSGNVDTLKMVGIVADDSANTTPAATTAAGSVLADRSSADAGDKTVRQIWTKGRFLMDFSVSLTQADLGSKAFALNNNDCTNVTTTAVALGTIVGIYSTSQAWVELNEAPKLTE